MRTRKWQDKQGNDRYTTEIIANEMQMVGSRQGGGSRDTGDRGGGERGGSRGSGRDDHGDDGRGEPVTSSTERSDFDDDIPF